MKKDSNLQIHSVPSRSTSKNSFRQFFSDLFNGIEEEFRFRKLSLQQYRDRLTEEILDRIEKFSRDQDLMRHDAQIQFESYATKINKLYNETIISLQRQQQSILELHESEAKQFVRPKRIDESIEEFRKSFNESEFMNSLLSNKWRPTWKRDEKSSSVFSKLDPFSTQIENLTEVLKKDWNSLFQVSLAGSNNADKLIKKSLDDLVHLQEELKQTSKLLEKAAKDLFPLILRYSTAS